MITLNLTANGNAEQKVKDYLEQNVSETLADKINNGVQIQKDGLTLINKKDLTGFMKHASDEARKQASQGSQYACIEDRTVYGWAVHFFEEDSIEGKLFNLDGTEYKPVVKEKPKPTTPKEPEKKEEQPTLFDLLGDDFTMPTIPTTTKPVTKVDVPPEPKDKTDNKYLSILNEILGGIVKEF